ncbi:Methyltransferase type 11 [Crinalium epipsammum PCC 9333]|uniref:Methyltransferase type 11 n=1 Tax=Crinalium epipsammum PCC 9333 TaxID=1173022 RepID=K9VW72_9CYAN|nr:class I SAM-dependent methyltransferase [Crinalium epipsammum]AFZ12353.1 Methyltransferase type 11 [Crinalium epipsammum PCC 9333]
MTTAVKTDTTFTSKLVNGLLSVKPLANLAKQQARTMMIKRAEKIGVYWRQEVEDLQKLDWDKYLAEVKNPDLTYPEYYLRTFHAYDEGNLGWHPALEVSVAARAVHAGIWQGAGAEGDAKLRESYHEVLKSSLAQAPGDILDVGCSVGMSTFALQELYPQANITGLDLSPYFLAVANYNSQQCHANINWVNAAAENTNLPEASFDLVSTFLVHHELPQFASKEIFCEMRRLLRPNGYISIMDMNPKSEIYSKMPPYILTLLKSTEPYLDEYFSLDIEQALIDAGFNKPIITCNSPRHRTIIAQVS